jgi:signal transduction histidine kinase
MLLLSLVYAQSGLGAPAADVQALALLLAATGAGSLLVGAAVLGWVASHVGSLRLRLLIGYGLGLLVMLAVVVVTSILMFLSAHDLSLLLLLLGFATAISLALGYSIASSLTDDISVLTVTARKLMHGDWAARVGATGSDEIAQLATTIDSMADQLRLRFEREHELDASRRNLIAGVSHDLRTPLATAQGMVESILDGVVKDPDEVQRFLRLIRADVQLLSRLIDDLFELSQIEAGALRLHLEPTLLGEVIATAIEPYQARSPRSGIAIECHVDPDLPAVMADGPRLQRVLRNLLDNAERYTHAGGSVRVEARRDGHVAVITVRDSGSGVSPYDLERVFDRFYQSDVEPQSASEPRKAGAGLGLAIARGLVEAHGGRIWAESAGSIGAVFRFVLPLTGVVEPKDSRRVPVGARAWGEQRGC